MHILMTTIPNKIALIVTFGLVWNNFSASSSLLHLASVGVFLILVPYTYTDVEAQEYTILETALIFGINRQENLEQTR